jgi:hypothetical protein
LAAIVQRIAKIEKGRMFKPIKTRTIYANGGTFAFVAVDNGGRRLFH